ncbi:hypothetical protein [Nostocoides sp. F2B08]|uniref:hypothetical protein n=1 Tax=Nostocoides sp. F2B08 TaxID=2653936 RepID=UPI00186AE949|nr:hypothetical protein [Tetrasphaera sp. F2B08]
MSRIDSLNQRYAASAAVARAGVQITAVGDPSGARFNAAVRRLVVALRDDGPGLWDDLIGASKALRWRLITQPQPIEFNPGLVQLAGEVGRQARRLRGAVADQPLLDELAASALAVAETDPLVGAVLLRDCLEAGICECVVIAASKPAQASLELWLKDHGILVLTAGELERDQPERDQAYVVGPPRFYRSSLVTAPVTSGISFLLPAWFGDRSVPRSAIAAYAEGAIRVEAKLFAEGDTSEPVLDIPEEAEDEDVYLPQPLWGTRSSDDREPSSEEVEARKVLLSGNLAMWLDDGERIRSLDPEQPVGERVTYTEVAAVRAGTYLLLRQGATERGALYHAALAKLGQRGGTVDAAQLSWKRGLSDRLELLGYRRVVKELRAAGVKTADRARAWTNPSLIRPNSDHDFEALLQWLDIPIQPTFGYATLLRKMLYQVSAEIGKQLEAAVSAADLTELETTGHLSLDVKTAGFRGILATRVLGIAPYSEIVSRHDARVPFEDRSGQWLE